MLSDDEVERAAQAFADALELQDFGLDQTPELRLTVEAEGRQWCWRRVCNENGCRMKRVPC